MKFSKYILMILILLSAFSCKKTNLKVTEPGSDLILDKMNSGSWPGVIVNGNNLTISMPDGSQNNYTFEESVLGIGGIYGDGSGGYLVALPAGDTLGTVTMDQEAKAAFDEIIDIVGPGNALGTINGILNSSDPNNLTPEDVIGNSNITEDERKRVEDILNELNGKNHFGTPDIIKPDTTK